MSWILFQALRVKWQYKCHFLDSKLVQKNITINIVFLSLQKLTFLCSIEIKTQLYTSTFSYTVQNV